jgi:hypothetical protein
MGGFRRTLLKSNKRRRNRIKQRKKYMKSEYLKTKYNCEHKRKQRLHNKYRRKVRAKRCTTVQSEYVFL